MTVDSVSERVRLAVKIRDDLASLANLRAAVREVGIVAPKDRPRWAGKTGRIAIA